MKILVVTVARYGDEPNVLQLFSTDWQGGGRTEYPRQSLHDLVPIVFEAAGKVDFVCIDECALGMSLIDNLSSVGVNNILTSHRLRPLGV